MAAQPQPTSPATDIPVTDRDKARALLALLDPNAARAKGTPSDAAPIPPADLRAMARDLIAQVEAKQAKPAPAPPQKHTAGPPASPVRPTPITETAPVAAPPDPFDQIPSEAPETAAPDAPPLVLSEREMLLPTFASVGRGPAQPSPETPATALFSRRAPLTLTVPRSETQTGRITLSTPSGFTPGPLPRTNITSPALDRAKVRALIAKTVKPHRLGAEHPAIAALILEGQPPLAQAEALRKMPHGQRRRVHRALRQIETA